MSLMYNTTDQNNYTSIKSIKDANKTIDDSTVK